jgi:transcriptional regulator with XRE-family HTH domain
MPQKHTSTVRQEEFKSVIKSLKTVLKQRGLSYKDLANRMGMSESGVKKIFIGSDCSFSRLVEITKIIGIKMSDVLQEVEREELRPTRFSSAQQETLIKFPELFDFYVKLVIERNHVKEIQKESALTEAQLFKFLKRLDELELIRLLPEGKIKLPTISMVSNFGDGPLLEKIYKKWGHSTIDELAHPKHQSSGHFIIRSLKMKEETYQDFLFQLRELEKNTAKKAIREMAFSTEHLKIMRWISLTDQESFVQGPLKLGQRL